MKIPQLETKIEYNTYITYLNNDQTYVHNYAVDDVGFENQLDSSAFKDNSIIQVESDYLLFEIEELNTDFIKENFDVEVFHMLQSAKSEKAYVWLMVGPPGGISNGESLRLIDARGNEYFAVTDDSKTADQSDKTKIGTSGVSTQDQLAESILKSISTSTLFQIGTPAASDWKLKVVQKDFGEKGNTKIGGSLIDKGYVVPQNKSATNDDTLANYYEQAPYKLKYFIGGSNFIDRRFRQLFFWNPEKNPNIESWNVEYFFDLKFDESIDSKFYCKADHVDKKQSLLSDQKLIFNCDEFAADEAENIYKIQVTQEDFEEPC